MIKRNWRALTICAAVLTGLWLLLHMGQTPAPVLTKPLPSDALLQIGTQNHEITVLTDAASETHYIPDGGSAVVTVKKDGVVDFTVKSKGLLLRPVIGPLVTTRLNIALGLQVAYWNRLEMYGGMVYPLAGFVACGYRLDQLSLNNTSLYVAYTTKKEAGIGVFLRF